MASQSNGNAPVDPPNNLDAEKTVLGSMILDNDCIDVVCGILKPQYFYWQRHQLIFKRVRDLHKQGIPIDYTTLIDEHVKRKEMDMIGGPGYIVGLEQHVFSTQNAEHHARIVLLKWQYRELIMAMRNAAVKCAEQLDQPSTILEGFQHAANSVVLAGHPGGGFKSLADVTEIIDDLEVLSAISEGKKLHENERRWAWDGLNSKVGDLTPGEVSVIAAKPGIGKTAMAIQQLEYICEQDPEAVGLFFSMEMPRFKIRRRTAMQTGHFDGRKFNTKKIDADDMRTLYYAYREKMPQFENLYVCANGPMSAGGIERETELFCRKEKKRPTIIIVDHMNTMTSDDRYVQMQSNEHLTETLIRLQKLASDYECPLILLAQLNKESYSDFDSNGGVRTPSTKDLKGTSTSIEKAKTIVLLHSIEIVRRQKNVVPTQAIILKTNDGEEGVVKCLYIKPLSLLIEETPQNIATYHKALKRFGWEEGRLETAEEEDKVPF